MHAFVIRLGHAGRLELVDGPLDRCSLRVRQRGPFQRRHMHSISPSLLPSTPGYTGPNVLG